MKFDRWAYSSVKNTFVRTGGFQPVIDSNGSISLEKRSGANVRLNVESENVVFDPQETGLISTTLSPAIRELKGLIDTNTQTLINKVDNTTFQALQTQVATLEGTVSAQATTIQEQQTKITELESRLGDIQTILESINGTLEE